MATITERPPAQPAGTRLTPRPTGHPSYSTTLERTEESAGVARRATLTTMQCWGVPQEAADAAVAIVSELVTNAIVHSRRGGIRLIYELPEPGRVLVAVVDRDAYRLPEVRTPAPDTDEGGRGLLLVAALSDRWGYDRMGSRPWGKRVWAELRVGGR
ncbi:ATP-binding protein [Streptomyces spinoverrucosus]|uniref:ATP-binding protein n=1 Tax=Streptomyces spinoverrucosus TaxID=284043 RepID=UPI0018C4396B|nr:ATP-binding protein [Streptomyces spinoverrucosus]MBG0854095.1 ATP-binding protein [Streptomyces spinoverrucosus]